MIVRELWRYPLKSLQGERLDAAEAGKAGLAGDRGWGLRSVATGRVLTARRRPELLFWSAVLDGGDAVLTLADGSTVRSDDDHVDDALSSALGEAVELVGAKDVPPSVGEFFADATDDSSPLIEWTMPAGRFVDAMPLLVLTTSSLRAGRERHPAGDWSTRRFRPNVVVDADGEGWVEDDWIGSDLHVGDRGAIVVPRARCERCTMVTRPQPGIERDLDVFRTLNREHGATFGVWAAVGAEGTIRVGDGVRVVRR